MAVHALPFFLRATLTAQGGGVLVADLPCAIWPATSRSVDYAGDHYTHEGEAPLEYDADLRATNVSLVVSGMGTFRVIECHAQSFVPHVALALRQTRAA